MKQLIKLVRDVQDNLYLGLSELAFPTRCVHCERPGELLCEACRESLFWIEQRFACPDCGSPYGYICCTECQHDMPSRGVVAALVFAGQAAKMVTALKDEHELRLAPIIAAAMAGAMEEAAFWDAKDGFARINPAEIDCICFVPATYEAYVRRGFDHMDLVSKELSKLTGIPVADILSRSSTKDQRELQKDERQKNLEGSVEALDDVYGLNILLVDDVLTTGSSIRECTRALLARGAKTVSALVLARVY